ncbi:hypothetical protein D3C78_1018110 [compost metagenome]
MLSERLPIHLLQIFMKHRTIPCNLLIRYFSDQINHVHTESANALFQPEIHQVPYLFPHFTVLPVQVRLSAAEQVQKVLTARFVEFPSRSAKRRSQGIGNFAAHWISPDVIVTIRVVFSFAGFKEPGMLIRGMVNDQVHNNPNTAKLGLLY